MIMRPGKLVALVLAAAAVSNVVYAGGEMVQPVPAPAPVVNPAIVPYNEYFCYSTYAYRSYVPGKTPHASSLFENPRTYPQALCVMATPYYLYAGLQGWFFGSPLGYQTSVPPESDALAYNQGRLGITDKLAHGWSEGMRVIEPVIVPLNGGCRSGGIFISAGRSTVAVAAPRPLPLPSPAPEVERER